MVAVVGFGNELVALPPTCSQLIRTVFPGLVFLPELAGTDACGLAGFESLKALVPESFSGTADSVLVDRVFGFDTDRARNRFLVGLPKSIGSSCETWRTLVSVVFVFDNGRTPGFSITGWSDSTLEGTIPSIGVP